MPCNVFPLLSQSNEMPLAGRGRFGANGAMHQMKNSDKKRPIEIIQLRYSIEIEHVSIHNIPSCTVIKDYYHSTQIHI